MDLFAGGLVPDDLYSRGSSPRLRPRRKGVPTADSRTGNPWVSIRFSVRHSHSITELIAPVLKLEPIAVYHFGSSSRDPARLRPDSDIDLAFLAARPSDPYRVFLTAQEIARIAGREVDLIDLRQAGSVIAAQVVGHGRRVFTASGGGQLVDEFELLALAAYARLNEERSEVLATELAR